MNVNIPSLSLIITTVVSLLKSRVSSYANLKLNCYILEMAFLSLSLFISILLIDCVKHIILNRLGIYLKLNIQVIHELGLINQVINFHYNTICVLTFFFFIYFTRNNNL